MFPTVGVQQVGTVTVTASGFGDIQPARSNEPFTNLTIIVKPMEADKYSCRYKVDVYHFGELAETHTYSTVGDAVVAHMMFPALMFPANVGTNAIPAFYDPDRADFGGIPILVRITNLESRTHVYEVYGVFEQFDSCRFGKIEQE
jgi:hypothetical protein